METINVKHGEATPAPQQVQFAFPCIGSMVVKKTTLGQPEMVSAYQTGMSLRDYFAGQCLGDIVAKVAMAYDWEKERKTNPQWSEKFFGMCSVDAYRMADAMIAERSKVKS